MSAPGVGVADTAAMRADSDTDSRTTTIVTAVAALAAVGVIGYGVHELVSGDSGDSADAVAMTAAFATGSATGSAGASPMTATAGASGDVAASAAAATSTTTSTTRAAGSVGGGCDAVATALTGYVRAARGAAASWSTHVGAQQRYDANAQSWATTRDQWARTKAAGPHDVQAYVAAKKSLDAALASCGTACASQAPAVRAYEERADAVVAQWKDHLSMMAAKPGTDPNTYHRMWMRDVSAARGPLAAFAAAPDPRVACR